jgi:hypothetical protein
MNTIREQLKENSLLEQLVGLFLTPIEMGKVRARELRRAVWPPCLLTVGCPRVRAAGVGEGGVG